MARLHDDRYFATEEEARAYLERYLADWAGAFSPYDGRATLVPPNAERATWLVTASRNSSAD